MVPTPAALRFALAAAHRMINWIHHHASHMGSSSLPASSACFAARHIHVIDVADLSNSRITGLVNSPDFSGWHFYQTITAFTIVQRCLLARAARDLATASRRQFNIVNV